MKHPTEEKGRKTMPLWPEAGQALGLGKNGTYEAAERGEIPGAFRIGGRWLVSVAVFEKFLDSVGSQEKTA
jgi:hypothetical protein